jgi:hypothetical protein
LLVWLQVCVAPRGSDTTLRLRLAEENAASWAHAENGESTAIADLTINEVEASTMNVVHLFCIKSTFSLHKWVSRNEK